MESVTVITEPLLHPDFLQYHHIVPILQRLRGRYDITVAAPRIGPLAARDLESRGMRVADAGAWFPPIRRSRDELPSFIGSWLRDSIWGWNRRDLERVLGGQDGLRVNVSMTTAIDVDIWQIQSRPLGQGLEAIRRGVTGYLGLALAVANSAVGGLDYHHVLEAGRRARVRYSSTQHVADWFAAQGLPVERIIPIYYRPTIFQSTKSPSRDYLLVYVGKETDSTAVRLLLDTGLPVKLFGSKSVGWVVKALKLERYPNARMLGHVSDEELSELYSHARFTAFPFTEEPFGLIPLESMACGTPVLTYGVQGPAESVLDRRTGWLVQSPEEFARRALELWNEGFPSAWMVEQCLARARNYDISTVSAAWKSVIDTGLSLRGTWTRRGRVGRLWMPTPADGRPTATSGLTPVLTDLPTGKSKVAPSTVIRPLRTVTAPAEPLRASEEVSPILARSGGYRSVPEPSGPDETVVDRELGAVDTETVIVSEPGHPREPSRLLSPTSEGSLSTSP